MINQDIVVDKVRSSLREGYWRLASKQTANEAVAKAFLNTEFAQAFTELFNVRYALAILAENLADANGQRIDIDQTFFSDVDDEELVASARSVVLGFQQSLYQKINACRAVSEFLGNPAVVEVIRGLAEQDYAISIFIKEVKRQAKVEDDNEIESMSDDTVQ